MAGACTLYDMCRRRIVRNIDMLEDVGDIPYSLIRPILMKIENPDKLKRIEERSPHIAEQDGEIWLMYIKRDIPNWQNKPHKPRNPKNWWKVYRKLKRDAEEEERAAEANLVATMKALKQEAEAESTKITYRNIDPTKRTVSGLYYRDGTFGGYNGTPRRSAVAEKAAFKKGVGKSVLAVAKREAAQAHRDRERQKPMHQLNLLGRKPKAAPVGWKERNMSELAPPPPPPPKKPTRIIAPARPQSNTPTADNLLNNEARLTAIKNGKLPPPAAAVRRTLINYGALAPSSTQTLRPMRPAVTAPPKLTTTLPKPAATVQPTPTATMHPLPHNPSYKVPRSQPTLPLPASVAGEKRKREANVIMPSKRR